VLKEPVEIPQWFADDPAVPVVTARVEPQAAWVVETYPCRSVVENEDGSFDIELPVTSEHWLSRMMLRSGDSVTITGPAEFADIQQRAARQVLARYEASSSGS